MGIVNQVKILGVAPEASTWFAVILTAIIGWTLTIFMLTKFRQRIVYWL